MSRCPFKIRVRPISSFADNSNFSIKMHQRRDASFYLCGEVSRFVYRLCIRCYTSDIIPLENSWFVLLGFRTREGSFMTGEEFLIRFNMTTNKVSAASKQKTEGVHSGKRVDRALIQKTADTIKSEFVQDGLCIYSTWFCEALRQTGLSSKIVKGLAAFDPYIMFMRPTEVALRHFDMLYSTFQRQSWVIAANESACRNEYVELLDYLRANFRPNLHVTDAARDLIDFMVILELQQTREHLLYLFNLCCLCIMSVSLTYPAVNVESIDTSEYRDRFTDVILPG